MLAIPLELKVAAVLFWANAQRARLALAPLDDLVPGDRLHPWACPLCRTVAAGGDAKHQPEFSGTHLRVWLRDTDLLVMEVAAPPVVVAWSEEFDRGGWERYAAPGGEKQAR